MSEHWFHLQSGAGGAAWNMALDEALLLACEGLDAPVLRFYGWSSDAATFGYFQKYADIAAWTETRPLIRRPTGGGLVPHTKDWTYSLAIPPNHWWYKLKALESYQQLHAWISESFASLAVTTELAPEPRKEIPGQCFAGAERFDLLHGGQKIAGAAQRRLKTGLLIQGSVQRQPPGIARADWERAMLATALKWWSLEWKNLSVTQEIEATARALEASKYALPNYNQCR